MKKGTAQKGIAAVYQATAVLNESLIQVQQESNDEDFRSYRLAVGKVMEMMYFEILAPAFREFPDLKPPGYP